ncbi:MAG: type IIL restriction-modification enzyme MmeI [Polaromonas sp.]
MTPQDFITKWGPGGPAFHLNEEQGAQSHFIDLCDVLGVHKPGSEDGYIFEKQTLVLGEARGYADVFKRGAFAWENKAPGKNLDSALKQLLNYSSALSNPPILLVCDRLQIRVQTQFTGHPTEKFTVLLAELAQPDKLALLRRIWLDPESFRPKITSRDITESAAKNFATLAEQLRKDGHEPQKVSHFLTQCLFCFFAEDVGLLPDRMFEKLISFKLDAHTPYGQKLPTELVTEGLSNLFNIMRTGGLFGFTDMIKFNGGLFEKVDVPKLNIINVTELRKATTLNWSAIDVSIFGTLFERGLDPAKRSQLGAHYTDPATIMRIIEPVMQRPLLQIWELLAPELIGLLAKSKRKYDGALKSQVQQYPKPIKGVLYAKELLSFKRS